MRVISHRKAKACGTETRSTLEARWAIFFRELNLKWKYEPTVLRGKGRSYTPDFHIEGFGVSADSATVRLASSSRWRELCSEHFGKFGKERNSAKRRKALRFFYSDAFWKEGRRILALMRRYPERSKPKRVVRLKRPHENGSAVKKTPKRLYRIK